MGIVRNLMVRAGADFSPLETAMRRTSNEVNSFGSHMEKALSGIKSKLLMLATAYVGITGLKDATRDAIELEATTANLQHILGESAADFIKWSQTTATSYGYSQNEAEKYGASFAHMISLFAHGSQDITKKTEDLMKTSAIIANGTGRSIDDVMQRIQSGMLGNVQAINDLGVYANQSMLEMSQGFKEIAHGRHWADLTMAERQQIIYMSIMEQASKQYGDTLENNVHNKLVTFTATLRNVRVALGNAFLPILNVALPVLTALAQRLLWVMNVVAAFMSALFGVKPAHAAATQAANSHVGAVNNQAGAMNKLGNAATNAANKVSKAHDKMKKSALGVAGFDQVNTLADKSDTSSSNGADSKATGAGDNGLSVPDITPTPVNFSTNAPEVSKKVQEMANKVKQIVKDVKNFMVANKTIITDAIAGIVAGFASFAIITKWSSIVKNLDLAWESLSIALAGISIEVIGVAAVIALFVGSLVNLWQTNEKFRDSVLSVWNQIKTFVTQVVSDMWEIVESVWDKYGASIVNGVAGFMKSIQDIIMNLWESYLKPVWTTGLQLLSNLWNDHLKEMVAQAADFVAKLVDDALQIWNKFISPIINWLIQNLGPVVAAVVNSLNKSFLTIVGVCADVASGLFKALGGIIDFITGVFTGNWSMAWKGIKEIFTGIMAGLYGLFKAPLDAITTFLSGPFTKTFNSIFTGFSDIVNGLKTTFSGVIDFITGVFTGNWSKAWNGVAEIFKGIFESLYGYVKTPLNWIIDAINTLINGLNHLSIDIPKWVPGFGGQKWGVNIPSIPHLATGGIVTSPTIAQIGEAGPEMVVPLENTSFVDKLASAVGTSVLSAMQFGNSNKNNGDVVIQLDGKTLARVLNPHLNKENNRVGKPILKGVGINASNLNYGQWS